MFDENKFRTLIWGEEEFPEKMEQIVRPWARNTLREGYINASDGTAVHYAFAVHPEEKGAIVLSHGFCEFIPKFWEVMYVFYQMGYSVFMHEYRSHGYSERALEEMDKVYVKDFSEFVDDLHSFVEQVVKKESTTGRLLLYGHSMGGCIATLYLEQYPEDFEKAALSAPMLKMDFRGVSSRAVRLLMVISAILPWDEKFVPKQHGFNPEPVPHRSTALSVNRYMFQLQERINHPEYTSFGGTYAWMRASIKATKKARHEAAKIQVPVLLCRAGMDTMVDNEGHTLTAERNDRIVMKMYSESKHEIYNATQEIRSEYFRDILIFFE